ncbi:MAG: citrate lyase holo-[acyl-carrier protein] synthase [Propionibacteriaceae bacterium]|nr:citrate lyase holo-[acyl-carrier protein] synthase [Propionibacteriaceae bacterium]
MSGVGVQLAELLAARDLRRSRQLDFLERYRLPLLSLTVVSPVPVKRSERVERVFAAAASQASLIAAGANWAVRARSETHARTGPELLMAVDAPPLELKAALVTLEDSHPWGRLFDLDVVTASGPLSRAEVGSSVRSCLVCAQPAAACARGQAHSAGELDSAIAAIMGRTAAVRRKCAGLTVESLGALAAEALRFEVRLAPKPGLVDVWNSGAHSDCELRTFLASADALQPWFCELARTATSADWTPAVAQELGRGAEASMFAATGGVNTHKGAIYVLGWLCVAAAQVLTTGGGTLADVLDQLAGLTSPLLTAWVAELGAVAASTNGERAYRSLGMTGVRGEAASGLATVRQFALPAWRQAAELGWAEDDAGLAALVALMRGCADTTLIARGGSTALQAVQRWAVDCPLSDPAVLRQELSRADSEFSPSRWSPGASADLLAATWFLTQLENHFGGQNGHDMAETSSGTAVIQPWVGHPFWND